MANYMKRFRKNKVRVAYFTFNDIQDEQQIDEQTIMFWNLQLQFMSRSYDCLLDVFEGIRYGKMYNGHFWYDYDKFYVRFPTEEQHMELATHLALHLSGIE